MEQTRQLKAYSPKHKGKPLGSNLETSVYGKVPPQATEIEEAVIGAILLEKDKIEDVMEILTNPEIFYKQSHQIIFATVREMFAQGRQIDLLTVSHELQKNGNLELVGGMYALTILSNKVLTSAHVITHSRVLKQKWLLREIISRCGEAIGRAYDDSEDVFEIIDTLGGDIDSMTEETINEDMVVAEDVYNDVLEALDKARTENKTVTGIPSGISSIDSVTHGWQDSDLIILAARPSVGKTALALNFAYNATKENVNVAFFSLEMPKSQLVHRLLSIAQGVPLEEIKQPSKMGSENWNKVTTCPHIGNNRLFLDDKSGIHPYLLKAKLKRLIRKRKGIVGKSEPWMVVIDYLQLMRWSEKGGNREQEIANISRTLKEIAKDLNCPIVALSQMSRGIEKEGKRKPQLSDLRESGAIEQDADMVMFLSRASDAEVLADLDLINVGYLNILKHRNGELRDITLFKDLRFQIFKDLAVQDNWKSVGELQAKEVANPYNPNAGFQHVEPEDLPF